MDLASNPLCCSMQTTLPNALVMFWVVALFLLPITRPSWWVSLLCRGVFAVLFPTKDSRSTLSVSFVSQLAVCSLQRKSPSHPHASNRCLPKPTLIAVSCRPLLTPPPSAHSLQTYDAAADAAVIEYKGHQLGIDTSLLVDFQFRIASLYEFIGEIEASREGGSQPEGGEGSRDKDNDKCVWCMYDT